MEERSSARPTAPATASVCTGWTAKRSAAIWATWREFNHEQNIGRVFNLLAGIVSADCIVKLSDNEVEKQVHKMVAKRGQAMDKVVESAVIDYLIKS